MIIFFTRENHSSLKILWAIIKSCEVFFTPARDNNTFWFFISDVYRFYTRAYIFMLHRRSYNKLFYFTSNIPNVGHQIYKLV